MGQVVPLRKPTDERDQFNAVRQRWQHERLPDGEFDGDGAQFLAVWALIVFLGMVAFLIGSLIR